MDTCSLLRGTESSFPRLRAWGIFLRWAVRTLCVFAVSFLSKVWLLFFQRELVIPVGEGVVASVAAFQQEPGLLVGSFVVFLRAAW